MLPVLILAGGRGTRLGELTDDRPKCMVHVNGEPFISHQLNLLRSQGVTDVVISTGYRGDQVADYVGDGSGWGINARCVRDGPEPLGTGGAVRKAAQSMPDAFFVMYGDSYLPLSLETVLGQFEFWGREIMTATQNDTTGHARNVAIENGLVTAYGEGDYIDYGLSILSKHSFHGVAEGSFPLSKVFERCIAARSLLAIKTGERFYEIGSRRGLAETIVYLQERSSKWLIGYHKHALQATQSVFALAPLIKQLRELRQRGGRLFVLGVGGSAANASHAVCDFRKLAAIEAYCPTDNAAEITARVNDDGWSGSYARWLAVSRISKRDAVLVLSVGGGTADVSPNLCSAIDLARSVGAPVLGIVGPNGGYTAANADACVKVPCETPGLATPIAEAFQSVLLHAIVSHPDVKRAETKW